MILAGLVLLAVGAADLVRQFAPLRWLGYLITAIVLLLLGSVSDAILPMIVAVIVGALWVWVMPADRPARLGFWPAVLLAILAIGAVVGFGARADAGLIGAVWELRSPFGGVPFDLAVLAIGAGVFLLESSNLVVRAALDGEHTWRPLDAVPIVAPEESVERRGFKGGRLIGPLERMLVLILTLASAYPLLAAMLAAKGIVRFPEISRDGESGARAEYFLVGSLVSWVLALGAAFLVWWAAHS